MVNISRTKALFAASIFAASVFVVPFFAGASPVVIGDFNKNNALEQSELEKMRDIALDVVIPTAEEKLIADTNRDGLIEITDIISTVSSSLNKDKELPCVFIPSVSTRGLFLLGDYNKNGQVTVDEIVSFDNFRNNIAVPSSEQLALSDWDKDGQIGVNDRTALNFNTSILTGNNRCVLVPRQITISSLSNVFFGKPYTIQWTSSGLTGGVEIGIKAKTGFQWLQYFTGLQNTGQFTWNVPSNLSTANDLIVVIYDATDRNFYRFSNQFNVVPQPSLWITKPTLDSTCTQNNICTISWIGSGIDSKVDIWARDSSNFAHIVAADAPSSSTGGTHAWAIPAGFPLGSYSIHMESDPRNSIKATSEPFTVKAPPPADITTFGATSVVEGGSSTLTWSTQNATSCTLSGGGKSGLRLTSSPAGGESTGPLVTDTTYTLTCSGQAGSLDSATAVARIIPEVQSVQVVGMVPGTRIEQGTQATISWTTKGPAGNSFNIVLVKDGRDVSTFSSGISSPVLSAVNPHSYSWTIPSSLLAGENYKIRVESVVNSAAKGESALFSIVGPPSITLVPLIGTPWQLGTSHVIQWTTGGIVGPVNVTIKLANPALFYNFDMSNAVVDQNDVAKLTDLILNSATTEACKTSAQGKECDLNMDGAISVSDIVWMSNNVILFPGARTGVLAASSIINSFTWRIDQLWIVPARDYIVSVYDKNNPSVETHSAAFAITPEPIQMVLNSVTLVPPPGTLPVNTNKFTVADTVMQYTGVVQNKGVRPVSGVSLSSYIEQGSARSEGYNVSVMCFGAPAPGTVKSGICTTSAPEQKISARINRVGPTEYDYNFDGAVDKLDASTLITVVLGQRSCPVGKNCDVDGDGAATENDVIQLVNKISLLLSAPQLKPGPAKVVFELKVGNKTFDTKKLDVIIEPPPTITVLAPLGGEAWPIGKEQTIKWNTLGLVGNVGGELRQIDPRVVYDFSKDGDFNADDIDVLNNFLATKDSVTCRQTTGLNCDVNGDGTFGVDDPVWLTDNILSTPPPQTVPIPISSASQSQKNIKWTPSFPPVLPGSYTIAIYDRTNLSVVDESGIFSIYAGPPTIKKPAANEKFFIQEDMKIEVMAEHALPLSDYKIGLYQNNQLIYENVRKVPFAIDSVLVRPSDGKRVIDLLQEGQLRIVVSGKLGETGFTNSAERIVQLEFDRKQPTFQSPTPGEGQEVNLGKFPIPVAATHSAKPKRYELTLTQNTSIVFQQMINAQPDGKLVFEFTRDTRRPPDGQRVFDLLENGPVAITVRGVLREGTLADPAVLTNEAKRTITVIPVPPNFDLNDDGDIDLEDFKILQLAVLGEYKCPLLPAAVPGVKAEKECDLNRDGKVDIADLASMISHPLYQKPKEVAPSLPAVGTPVKVPTVTSPKAGATWSVSDSITIQEVTGATGYLVGFIRDRQLIHENYRDEGKNLNDIGGVLRTTYQVSSAAASKFSAGPMTIIVRALVNNQWTDAAVIPVTVSGGGAVATPPSSSTPPPSSATPPATDSTKVNVVSPKTGDIWVRANPQSIIFQPFPASTAYYFRFSGTQSSTHSKITFAETSVSSTGPELQKITNIWVATAVDLRSYFVPRDTLNKLELGYIFLDVGAFVNGSWTSPTTIAFTVR